MSDTYEVDAKAVFNSRFESVRRFGIPRAQSKPCRTKITDMWADAPGGWPFEWSGWRELSGAGKPFLASIAYGYAKFPCLADNTRRKALQNQVAAYLAAAPSFPVEFERRTIKLPYRGASVDLPVHLFSVSGDYSREPVLMFSGGVDTYKMDCHDMCVTLAQRTGSHCPGVRSARHGGESRPADDRRRRGRARAGGRARRLGNGKVAHLGMSFGGNFSAMTGLSGAVDAAINLGGPIDSCFEVGALVDPAA